MKYLILVLLTVQFTYGINVGVGISDVTGPAAEIGMVSKLKIPKYPENS